MKKLTLNPPRRFGTALAVVVLAGAGGCEEMTNPTAAPGGLDTRLAVQAGANSDRAALMALYEATDGANWDDDTNWGTDEDLGDWYGVWTNSDGRVEEVVIRDNGLSGQIPPELEGLGALRRLDLSYHPNLSGSVPPELGNLGELRVLAIINTSLSGGIPPELGNLSSLVALDLRNEGMSGSIPPELGNLSSLEILYLVQNGMSGSIPPELGNLSSLRWLGLNNNSLSGQIPSELGHITGLEHLFLDGNQLSGAIPSSLGNLAAAERMIFQQNKLTGVLPNSFLNLRLDEFSMWGNAGLCYPATPAFRSWLEGMEVPDYHIDRMLCSEDREALLGVHEALDGSNWTDSNWGDDTNIRSWRGVTLDSDVRVTELRLADSGLSGELPTVLANIDRLKVLVLEGNGLVGEVPEAVMELDLDVFWWSDNPGLCIPDTEAFRNWLRDMRSTSGPICGH